MEILFLGTSSGTPSLTRNVSGAAVRRKNSKTWYLVDCGEGTQHQILKTSLSLIHLEAIFITHVHGDHCFGLPGLLSSATMLGRSRPLTIVAPQEIEQFVNAALKASDTRMSYAVNFTAIDDFKADAMYQGGGIFKMFVVRAHELSHRAPSHAYSFTEKGIMRKLNVEKLLQDTHIPKTHWGRLQKGETISLEDGTLVSPDDYLLPPRAARTVIISGDNDKPELLVDIARESDVLVHESTFTHAVAEKIGPAPMHSSARRVAEFSESVGLPNLILTHFSPRYKEGIGEGTVSEIKVEAESYYSGNLYLAEDFSIFSLDIDGKLVRK